MVYNKIQVAFGSMKRITGPAINYQYDVKQILVINGLNLPEYYVVDFCNEGDATVIPMTGTSDGVEIPDSLLQTGKPVKAYIVVSSGQGDVQTRYEVKLPVNTRPMRDDIHPTDPQQQQIDALVAALNSGVERAEEAVEHYPKIIEGYWYLWENEEYVPTGIKAEGTDGVSPTVTVSEITGGHRITITDWDGSRTVDVMDGEDGTDGKDGKDGTDGYSPVVTVTTITGGHRVTITDEDHPQGQSFDVMDGQGGGGTSDYTDLTNKPSINNVTLTDNKTAADLGLATPSDIPTNAGDIAFSESGTYDTGTVGAELSQQKNAISALDSDVGDLDDLITTDKSSLVAAINEAAISGGGGITLIVNREDGVTIASGVTVTVTKGTGASAETDTYAYTGQPLTIPFVVDAAYRISVSGAITGFVTPPDAFGTYLGPQLIILTYATVKRYGYRREKTESNCADRITYLFDAVGMTPAGMTYNSSTHLGTFDYGSWEAFCNQIARPVMLNPDGTIKYELDHDNQLYRIDGSPSEVELTAQTANAMTEFGSAFKWVKRYEDEDYEYVIFCNTQYDSDYHAYAHTGDDGNIKDAFYIGMWPGPVASSKLRSIADGSAVSNTITMQVAITDAKAVGTGFNIIYKSAWDYVADLLTLISKTDNSQAAFGNGRQALGSLTNNRGVTSSLRNVGAFYGYNDNSHDVKVFWLVQWWGNIWQWIHGLVNDNGDLKVRMYGPYCDTPVSAADYSTYTSTELDAPQTGGGFQSESHMTDAYGYLWTKTAGSASTYVPDRGSVNNDQVSLPLVGASWYNDAGLAGSRTLTVNTLASYSTANLGSRLSYVPV